MRSSPGNWIDDEARADRLFNWLGVNPPERVQLQEALKPVLSDALRHILPQPLAAQIDMVTRGMLGPPAYAKAILMATAKRISMATEARPLVECELSDQMGSGSGESSSSPEAAGVEGAKEDSARKTPQDFAKLFYNATVIGISTKTLSELMLSWSGGANDTALLVALLISLSWSCAYVAAQLMVLPYSPLLLYGRLPQTYTLQLGVDRLLREYQYPILHSAGLLASGSVVISVFNEPPSGFYFILDALLQLMLPLVLPGGGRLAAFPALGRLCTNSGFGAINDCVITALSLQYLIYAARLVGGRPFRWLPLYFTVYIVV